MDLPATIQDLITAAVVAKVEAITKDDADAQAKVALAAATADESQAAQAAALAHQDATQKGTAAVDALKAFFGVP